MGDLQSIGHGGQPTPVVFRAVDPPQDVLVDLVALFPREPHSRGRYHPFGLQMHKVVRGELTRWGMCEQGHWWGPVSYPVSHGPKSDLVTHWIPAWMLKKARPG